MRREAPAGVICVDHLSKTYRVPKREAGLRAAVRGLVRPEFETVEAVKDISFTVESGEMVGLIGPNGAGKTTTLKMLAGLLYPSSGDLRVANYVPWRRQPDFLRRISMVMGNKSQLNWDIPPADSFLVLGEIYSIPAVEFRRRLGELIDLLDLDEVLKKPVRNLSLGERMKCELVAGLLHCPPVLFLDEPTLGLDVSMQARLRSFIAEYNRRYEACVILTSHYMADVVALCSRIILIHNGSVLYDGALNGLARQLSPFKLIRLALDGQDGAHPGPLDLPAGVEDLGYENERLTLRVARDAAPAVTANLLERFTIQDLSVEDPPIEAVIDRIFQGGDL